MFHSRSRYHSKNNDTGPHTQPGTASPLCMLQPSPAPTGMPYPPPAPPQALEHLQRGQPLGERLSPGGSPQWQVGQRQAGELLKGRELGHKGLGHAAGQLQPAHPCSGGAVEAAGPASIMAALLLPHSATSVPNSIPAASPAQPNYAGKEDKKRGSWLAGMKPKLLTAQPSAPTGVLQYQ